jgi:hypothetical protein
MSINAGPDFVTENCILLFDAASILTNPGSQIYRNPYSPPNFSYAGAPTTTSGALVMDGVDDYLEAVSVSTNTVRTVNIVYKLINPGTGFGPLWRADDWRERIFPSSINLIASSGTYYYLDGPAGNTDIINICYSYNGTNAKSYKNGSLISNITMDSSMNTGTYSYRFGNQSSGSTNAYVNMNLYHVAFYSTQLSDTNVMQNFNALRGRYGI